MPKQKPICFVIMGFGKKTDPITGKTLDLDKTYKNIIRPSVIEAGYECMRADEIKDSGLIDKSMYALLIQSELVIADISTYNPNAIYELGVRHAVKPFSTIILKEKEGKIPFDLDHNRMFIYCHLGEDIGVDEAERCQKELIALIQEVSRTKHIDSPLYEMIHGVSPIELPQEEYRNIIEDLAEKEKHIFAIVEKANQSKADSDFETSAKFWKKASEKVSNEPYFIQQWALCTYKSKQPSEEMALIDALNIINVLEPDGATNDPETLGITGAIYKRLWHLNENMSYLDRAILYYGKCFKIRGDYYTGENYALCLEIKSKHGTDVDEQTYNRIAAKKVREEIIASLSDMIDFGEVDQRLDRKWIYATLSHCYYAIKNNELYALYEQKFFDENPVDWEKNTYSDNKEVLTHLIN